MTNVVHALLTTICITIPEQVFMVVITLLFMGRKDMLDLYNIKTNITLIMKIVIPSSFIINILNFIIKTPSSINSLMSLTILYISLVYIIKKNSFIDYPKLYQKAFAFFILSIIISIAIETITYPIILKLMDKSYQEILKNFNLVIMCSLASRIIDIVILAYIFIKKNNKIQLSIGDYIFKNKFFMRLTVGLILGLILFEIYVIKLILWNDLLHIVSTIYEQMFIVIGSTFLIPALLITTIYSCINYCVTIHSEKADCQK